MPCMYNGMPVKGVKGACPMNSTWVEDEPKVPVDNRSLGQKGIDLVKNNPLEAASLAALAIPIAGGPISAGIRGAGALYKGAKMSGRMGSLMDRIFRKPGGTVFTNPVPGGGVLSGGQKFRPQMFNQTTKGGLPVQPKFTAYNAPYNRTAGRVMRTPSLMQAGGAGLLGAGSVGLYASGADERAASARALQEQQQQQASDALNANTKALMDANATKAEADRVAGLNPMQRMMENLKNPEFLNESMSGQPGDTRLNRLGQLMSYYGGTPKQRAAMGDPQKRFAEIESNVATNKAALAKAQATLQGKSPFGSLGTTGLAKGLESLVKERYPSTFGFGGIDDKDVEGVAARVASVMQQLAQENPLTASQPGGIEQIREAAFAQVEQELGL